MTRPVFPMDADVTPGFMFLFGCDDSDNPPFVPGPWLVLHKCWGVGISGDFHWRYLCLGPQMQLQWHNYLGRVHIISDTRGHQEAKDGH